MSILCRQATLGIGTLLFFGAGVYVVAGEQLPELPPEISQRAVAVVNGEEIPRGPFFERPLVRGIMAKNAALHLKLQIVDQERQRLIAMLIVDQYVRQTKLPPAPPEAQEADWQRYRRTALERFLRRPIQKDEPAPEAWLAQFECTTEAEAKERYLAASGPNLSVRYAALLTLKKEDIRAFYDANAPRKVSVIHTAAAGLELASEAEAAAVLKKRAERLQTIRAEIKAGTRTFDAAAQVENTEPYLKQNRGELGVLIKSQPRMGIQSLYPALFALGEGEVSEVLTVDRDLFLAKVTKVLSYEEAEGDILDFLLDQAVHTKIKPFSDSAQIRLAPLVLPDEKETLKEKAP